MPRLNDVLYFCVISLLHSKQVSSYSSICALAILPKIQIQRVRQITYFAKGKLMNKNKQVIVIGAGFAGLSAAALIAKAGHHVTLLEKNDQTGGRARVWEKDGFRFDMGPGWYWMPGVFENYFSLFDK